MDTEHERRFELFGSRVALHIGVPSHGGRLASPELVALEAEATLRRLHLAWTRFDADSELSRLNRDPRVVIPASATLVSLVEAVITAARLSDGLVDCTQLGATERSGYPESRVGLPPAPLRAALDSALERHPAVPGDGAWKALSVNRRAMTIIRPVGLRVDSGGIGKGLAADLVAERLTELSSFAVDCGGDIRIGGTAGLARTVEVDDPFDDSSKAASFQVTSGAVATSGLRTRVWRQGDSFAHHLIDPARGEPAWTGLVQATAIARTALEAEVLAKCALLAGPDAAGTWLARFGGVVIDDDGEVTRFGPLASTSESHRTAA